MLLLLTLMLSFPFLLFCITINYLLFRTHKPIALILTALNPSYFTQILNCYRVASRKTNGFCSVAILSPRYNPVSVAFSHLMVTVVLADPCCCIPLFPPIVSSLNTVRNQSGFCHLLSNNDVWWTAFMGASPFASRLAYPYYIHIPSEDTRLTQKQKIKKVSSSEIGWGCWLPF